MDNKATPLPLGAERKNFIRVTGVRLGRFVEFQFWVDDPDLGVELILPFAAFEDFCRAQRAEQLPPDENIARDLEQQAWRARQPGLLRRVSE